MKKKREKIREKINERLVEEAEAFIFHNKLTTEEFSKFFGFPVHKLHNWKNSQTKANPTSEDLHIIENTQRSLKGNSLSYKINTYYIFSGFRDSEADSKLREELKHKEDIIVSLNIELIKIREGKTS